MTTDELIAELAERGLNLELVDGEPRLRGDRTKATPTLLAVLRHHRPEIIRRLGGTPPMEWLWRTGHRYVGTPDVHPAGAWWVRDAGGGNWHLINERRDHVLAEFGPRALQGYGLPPGESLAGAVPDTRRPHRQPEPVARSEQRPIDDRLLGGLFQAQHFGREGAEDERPVQA